VARRAKIKGQCLNCKTSLKADYEFCPKCGQENRDLKISFWELISEFLSSNFNFDTKLGRTLVDLLLKPGEITKQFNIGKRIAYVKPVQMYFFVSFIYFLLLSLEPGSFVNKNPPSNAQISVLNNTVNFNFEGTDFNNLPELLAATDPENNQEIDSLITKLGDTKITSWNRHLMRQAVRAMKQKDEEAFTHEVYANLSIAMFFLLPLFALLLWLFTRDQSPFYMDALVFSIHYHCVVLLILSINMMIGLAANGYSLMKVSLFLMILYLWVALKRVFQLNWLNSLGKTFGISAIYTLTFGLCFVTILLFSFWLY